MLSVCVLHHWLTNNPYLLLLSTLQISPLLCYMAEVHLVHGHLDVADGIVFGEAVKVVHRHHQRLASQLDVGHLYEHRMMFRSIHKRGKHCLIKIRGSSILVTIYGRKHNP